MSSSGLYGYKANVTVSANNLTTLYNAQPGNVKVVDVPDRNFTTLYTNQTTISPTKAYGNANVEAFLNAGTDGANTVQNIHMTGNIYVGGSSYLGNVGNIHITGGNSGYVLTTNGIGNLIWAEPSGGGGNGTDYIHFDVSITGNNIQFVDGNLSVYANSNVMNVFKNGVNLEPFYYEKVADDILQINIQLHAGDTIDVLASTGGGGELPGGPPLSVQYNTGYVLGGSSAFTFDPMSNVVTIVNNEVGNLTVNDSANLGSVSNITIEGGTSGQYLSTDGAGNLSWASVVITSVNHANYADVANSVAGANVSGYVANATHANIADVANSVAGANVTGQVSYAAVANSVAVANVSGIGNIATINKDGSSSHVLYGNGAWASIPVVTPAGANTDIQFNDNGSFGAAANLTFNKTTDTLSVPNIAGTLTTASQYNITDVGTLNALFVEGIVNLGTLSNIHIGGGSAGYVLTTDGASNLTWAAGGSGGSAIANGTSNVSIPVSNGNINFSAGGVANVITVASNVVSITTTTSLQQVEEKFVSNGTGATGTVNFDVLTSAIILQTANATANFTLNVRGNASATFDSMTSTGQSVSITYINKNDATIYYPTVIKIDGNVVTPVWLNGLGPGSTTFSSTYDSYSLNILKTGSNAFTVFGSFGSYT